MAEARGLAGQTALVTGGSSGIGRAAALALAQAGVRTFICARTEAAMAETATLAGLKRAAIEYRRTDVGSPPEVDALFRWIRERAGNLDILVNAAGILGRLAHLVDITPDEWDAVIRINLTGTFLTCRAAARIMADQKTGCIINLTSGLGRHGRARWGPYAVSKFGVEGLTQTLAEELASSGIRVLAINPGKTRTPMRAAAYPTEDPATLQTTDAVAIALLRLIANPDLGGSGMSVNVEDILDRNAR